jgi:hypothetical protein
MAQRVPAVFLGHGNPRALLKRGEQEWDVSTK